MARRAKAQGEIENLETKEDHNKPSNEFAESQAEQFLETIPEHVSNTSNSQKLAIELVESDHEDELVVKRSFNSKIIKQARQDARLLLEDEANLSDEDENYQRRFRDGEEDIEGEDDLNEYEEEENDEVLKSARKIESEIQKKFKKDEMREDANNLMLLKERYDRDDEYNELDMDEDYMKVNRLGWGAKSENNMMLMNNINSDSDEDAIDGVELLDKKQILENNKSEGLKSQKFENGFIGIERLKSKNSENAVSESVHSESVHPESIILENAISETVNSESIISESVNSEGQKSADKQPQQLVFDDNSNDFNLPIAVNESDLGILPFESESVFEKSVVEENKENSPPGLKPTPALEKSQTPIKLFNVPKKLHKKFVEHRAEEMKFNTEGHVIDMNSEMSFSNGFSKPKKGQNTRFLRTFGANTKKLKSADSNESAPSKSSKNKFKLAFFEDSKTKTEDGLGFSENSNSRFSGNTMTFASAKYLNVDDASNSGSASRSRWGLGVDNDSNSNVHSKKRKSESDLSLSANGESSGGTGRLMQRSKRQRSGDTKQQSSKTIVPENSTVGLSKTVRKGDYSK